MSADFFRNYIDIIKEAEQPRVQLDEGMLQDLKSKISALMTQFKTIPGIGQAYQKAKSFAPELKQIFMSAKSGKELMDSIKRLATAKSGIQPVAEDIQDHKVAVGAATSLAGISITLWEMATGFFDIVLNLALNDTGANQAVALWFLVMPLVIVIMGAFLIYAGGEKR